jgi:hypothetical protein
VNHVHLTLNGDPPFHEELALAIHGYKMLRGRLGNLPSITGARSAGVLSKLTLPLKPSFRS